MYMTIAFVPLNLFYNIQVSINILNPESLQVVLVLSELLVISCSMAASMRMYIISIIFKNIENEKQQGRKDDYEIQNI